MAFTEFWSTLELDSQKISDCQTAQTRKLQLNREQHSRMNHSEEFGRVTWAGANMPVSWSSSSSSATSAFSRPAPMQLQDGAQKG